MRRALSLAAALGLAACSTEVPTSAPPAPPVPDTRPASERPELPRVPEPCEAELTAFEADVWRPILSTKCLSCHQAEGPAKDSRLVLLPNGAPDARAHNFEAAGRAAATLQDGLPLLQARPSGRHPEGHPGGLLFDPGSEDDAALAAFATYATTAACDAPTVAPTCEGPDVGARLLRRLSHDEYEATVAELFLRPRPSVRFAADPVVEGFDNHARSLAVSALLADQLRAEAERLAEQAAQDLERFLPCTPSPGLEDDCRDLFLEDFGARAFRRPLEVHEVERYRALFEATADGDFATGVQWVVTAMLQSPYFLYRSELGVRDGEVYRLTEHEIASELSYFLTGGPPDEALVRAAEQGILSDPDERARQAERLLRTQAARAAVTHFFFSWLDLDRLQTVPKDAATFPELDDPVRAAMRAETERFLADVLWRQGGGLDALLTAPYTFVDPTLERFYGVNGVGEPDQAGFRRAEAPGLHYGLLTQGSLLTTHARANDSSPIHRGKLVRERLLCQPLELPPPGLAAEPPPPDPNQTTRERYAGHSSVEPCRSCHRLIDPIGFGFEAFDGAGRFRAVEAGQRIDATGEIVDTAHTDGPFDGVAELAARLAGSEDVARCFVDRLQRFAYGVGPEAGLECGLERAQASFEAGGKRFSAAVEALVRAPHFAARTATTAP